MCGLVYRVCHIAGFTAVLFPIPDAVFRPLSICACVFACNKHFLQKKKKKEDSYTSTIHDRFWSAGILQKGDSLLSAIKPVVLFVEYSCTIVFRRSLFVLLFKLPRIHHKRS